MCGRLAGSSSAMVEMIALAASTRQERCQRRNLFSRRNDAGAGVIYERGRKATQG